MENRPKNMPRWQWSKIKEDEKERLTPEKSLEVVENLNVKKIKEFIWSSVVFIVIFMIIILIAENNKNKPIYNECGYGYHWEEDRMMINGGCVSDYK